MLFFIEETVLKKEYIWGKQDKFDLEHTVFEMPVKYPCEVVKVVSTQSRAQVRVPVRFGRLHHVDSNRNNGCW